jgi:hypothetical protein
MACAYRGCFKVCARTSISPAHFKFSAPLACLVMTAAIMDLRYGHYCFFDCGVIRRVDSGSSGWQSHIAAKPQTPSPLPH